MRTWHKKNIQSNHCTDNYSQKNLTIWPVWLNGWVFVYELHCCGFESRCSPLNSKYYPGSVKCNFKNTYWEVAVTIQLFLPSRHLVKVNNRNARARYQICSKLTIKTPERRYHSGVFIINFEHGWHLVLVFLLLTLKT